jgi:NCS1 family nucleobase:cation symporter-1
MYGSYPAIIMRCILSLLWVRRPFFLLPPLHRLTPFPPQLAIQTYLAGNQMSVFLGSMFPSFLRIKNTLPEGLGITSSSSFVMFSFFPATNPDLPPLPAQTLIGFIIYWCIQTPVSCIPVHKMRYVFLIKTAICPLGYIAIAVWGLVVSKGKGELLTGSFQTVEGSNKAIAIFSAINALAGLYSTLQVNVADFLRFGKSTKSNYMQLIAIPLTGTIPVACGIIATAAAAQKYGVEAWDPSTLTTLWGSSSGARAAQFFASLVFLLSTLGVNISAVRLAFPFSFSTVSDTFPLSELDLLRNGRHRSPPPLLHYFPRHHPRRHPHSRDQPLESRQRYRFLPRLHQRLPRLPCSPRRHPLHRYVASLLSSD